MFCDSQASQASLIQHNEFCRNYKNAAGPAAAAAAACCLLPAAARNYYSRCCCCCCYMLLPLLLLLFSGPGVSGVRSPGLPPHTPTPEAAGGRAGCSYRLVAEVVGSGQRGSRRLHHQRPTTNDGRPTCSSQLNYCARSPYLTSHPPTSPPLPST